MENAVPAHLLDEGHLPALKRVDRIKNDALLRKSRTEQTYVTPTVVVHATWAPEEFNPSIWLEDGRPAVEPAALSPKHPYEAAATELAASLRALPDGWDEEDDRSPSSAAIDAGCRLITNLPIVARSLNLSTPTQLPSLMPDRRGGLEFMWMTDAAQLSVSIGHDGNVGRFTLVGDDGTRMEGLGTNTHLLLLAAQIIKTTE